MKKKVKKTFLILGFPLRLCILSVAWVVEALVGDSEPFKFKEPLLRGFGKL